MNSATLAEYIMRLLTEPVHSLTGYDDDSAAQIIQEVSHGIGAGMSDVLQSCTDEAVIRMLEATPTLFREYLAPRCSRWSSEYHDVGTELEGAAFMFYDSWLLNSLESGHSLHRACATQPLFRAIEQTLALEHELCQCAALHGLGHIRRIGYSSEVEAIIDAYLKRSSHDVLRGYALEARRGEVL